MRVRKALLPVAGLGTRFLPATKAMPKELLSVVDKPLVEHAVDEARAAGIEEFIFISSRGKNAIEDHFDCHPELERQLGERGKTAALNAVKGAQITDGHCAFVRQQRPLGLGHAVWCARHFVHDEPFAVILPDDLILGQSCLKELVDWYETVGHGSVIGVQKVAKKDVSKYGIMDVSDYKGSYVRARGFCEKPDPAEAPSDVAAIGRYILDPAVLKHLDDKVVGAGGEIQLTDAIAKCLPHSPLYGYFFSGQRFDCGDKAGFVKANVAYAMMRGELSGEVLDFLRETVAAHDDNSAAAAAE